MKTEFCKTLCPYWVTRALEAELLHAAGKAGLVSGDKPWPLHYQYVLRTHMLRHFGTTHGHGGTVGCAAGAARLDIRDSRKCIGWYENEHLDERPST